jgi:hypothetical protein
MRGTLLVSARRSLDADVPWVLHPMAGPRNGHFRSPAVRATMAVRRGAEPEPV